MIFTISIRYIITIGILCNVKSIFYVVNLRMRFRSYSLFTIIAVNNSRGLNIYIYNKILSSSDFVNPVVI